MWGSGPWWRTTFLWSLRCSVGSAACSTPTGCWSWSAWSTVCPFPCWIPIPATSSSPLGWQNGQSDSVLSEIQAGWKWISRTVFLRAWWLSSKTIRFVQDGISYLLQSYFLLGPFFVWLASTYSVLQWGHSSRLLSASLFARRDNSWTSETWAASAGRLGRCGRGWTWIRQGSLTSLKSASLKHRTNLYHLSHCDAQQCWRGFFGECSPLPAQL